MALKVKQFRYYSEGNTKNEPNTLTKENLVNGSCFADFLPIAQLGIQALPGTQFLLNGSEHSITIGNTGIYELELDRQVKISELRFTNASVSKIEDNNNAVLIVDMVYGEEE